MLNPDPDSCPSVRARELLESLLTLQQLTSWRNRGYFEFRGSAGTCYRLYDAGYSFNIHWIRSDGLTGGVLCAYPKRHKGEKLPTADLYIGQFLALVTNEEAFLDVANLGSGKYPPVGNFAQRAARSASMDLMMLLTLFALMVTAMTSFIWFLVSLVQSFIH